jgi:hypothetical protein
MRKQPILTTLALALPLLLTNAGCLVVPEVEDRTVELAVGASTTAEFVASGEINTHDKTDVVDVKPSIDLDQVLANNGVDASDVKDIKLASVSYRVTKAEPGRSITGGTVTIKRGSGAVTPLVTSFSANCGSTTGWIAVPLDANGVTLTNQILADLLTEAQGKGAATNTVITYHVSGVSVPGATPTNFTWEFKLEVSIVGKVKVKIIT